MLPVNYFSLKCHLKTNRCFFISDTGIALLGGFAIYEVLGYMQYKCDKDPDCTTNYYNQASMGLAFVAYPAGNQN